MLKFESHLGEGGFSLIRDRHYLYNTFIPRYVLLRKIDVTNVTK
jgi:hypothetical protein